jgi:hypothetical protein
LVEGEGVRFGTLKEFREWDARRRERLSGASVERPPDAATPPKPRMNKTEAARAQVLELAKRTGSVREYWFEGGKFRLGDGTFYTPDFMVWYANGSIGFEEIKGGFIREDGLVKFKWAKDKFPCFKWSLWQRRKTQWVRLM